MAVWLEHIQIYRTARVCMRSWQPYIGFLRYAGEYYKGWGFHVSTGGGWIYSVLDVFLDVF